VPQSLNHLLPTCIQLIKEIFLLILSVKQIHLIEKKCSGFYIFDIESNPDEKHDFLYGFLKVNNLSTKKEDLIYEPILNLKNNKGESYRQIIEILFSQKNGQFCITEKLKKYQ